MRTAETYRGFEVVETDWTTEVRVGSDRAEVRPVYVIPGMKERPSSPFLTTVQEARDYIDEELAGREAMREARTATFEASVKVRGAASLGVTIPAPASRALGLDVGDRVRVTVEKMARRGAGKKVPARSCALAAWGAGPDRRRARPDSAWGGWREATYRMGRAGHGKAHRVVRRGVDGGGVDITCISRPALRPRMQDMAAIAVRMIKPSDRVYADCVRTGNSGPGENARSPRSRIDMAMIGMEHLKATDDMYALCMR